MSDLEPERAISSKFVEQIAKLCGLEVLRAGRHVLRDERGWKTAEMHVLAVWIAEIEPTFMEHACICMITTERDQRAFFCVDRDHEVVTIGPITGERSDPVKDLLQGLDLWTARRTISVDGIAYRFYLDTQDVRLALYFANPAVAALVRFEGALLQVTAELEKHDSTGTVARYRSEWRGYAAEAPL